MTFLRSNGVENIAKKQNSTGLIHRVSSIFKRKDRPAPLKLNRSAFSTVHTVNDSVNEDDDDDDDDDIRRPSGLGSAVSVLSLPPSPSHPPSSALGTSYSRIRAISSPNLFSRLRSKSKHHLPLPIPIPIPTPLPIPIPTPRTIPVETISLILSHLPRNTVASLACISKSFSLAARSVLFSSLSLQHISPSHLEALIALLASRTDLTDLVRSFSCTEWPAFYLSSPTTHHSTLLTATLTLAFQHMAFLTHIVLPTFDPSLLAHHSSFGLKSITFLNSSLSAKETLALLTWLNGQTNVSVLRLPNLVDQHTHIDENIAAALLTSSSLLPILNELHAPPSLVALLASSPTPPPTPSPTKSDTGIASSPHYLHPHHHPLTPRSAPTTPHVAHSKPPIRPLQKVHLNITTTLYTGLRPAALMASLVRRSDPSAHSPAPTTPASSGKVPFPSSAPPMEIMGPTHLVLSFGLGVDRRTVEKVLAAAGAVLGGPYGEESEEKEKWVANDSWREKRMSRRLSFPWTVGMAKEKEKEKEKIGEMAENSTTKWEGLEVLELQFAAGTDEALYKTIHTVLPRYTALRVLRVQLVSQDSPSPSPTSSHRLKSKPSSSSLSSSLSPVHDPNTFFVTNGSTSKLNTPYTPSPLSDPPSSSWSTSRPPPYTPHPTPSPQPKRAPRPLPTPGSPPSRPSTAQSTVSNSNTGQPFQVTQQFASQFPLPPTGLGGAGSVHAYNRPHPLPPVPFIQVDHGGPSSSPHYTRSQSKSLVEYENGGLEMDSSFPEQARMEQWARACTRLEEVVLFSGARWVKGEGWGW